MKPTSQSLRDSCFGGARGESRTPGFVAGKGLAVLKDAGAGDVAGAALDEEVDEDEVEDGGRSSSCCAGGEQAWSSPE